mgnify:CR=1 FL=1
MQREARRKQRHRHALRRRLIAEQIIGQCALKARVEPNIKQPLHYIAQLCVHISLRLCERHIRRAARLPFHIFSHIEYNATWHAISTVKSTAVTSSESFTLRLALR